MKPIKTKPARIALNLPAELDAWFTDRAARQLTSKASVIRAVLADHVRNQQPV